MTTDDSRDDGLASRCYLREWRRARGMRQEDLGRLVGVNKSVISRCEAGTHGISMEFQLKLMRALDIMPNQFFSPPDQPSIDALARGLDEDVKRRLVNFAKAYIADSAEK